MTGSKALFTIFFLSSFFSTKIFAQKPKSYNTTIKKANIVYIGNKLTGSQKANVLLVNKYINKDEYIKVKVGSNTARYPYEWIKKGFQPITSTGSNGVFGIHIDNIINLKIVGNNLLINSRVKSIDQKLVASIKDNKLEINKGLIQRSSDRFIEIIDEYDIPVLQVVLSKDNTIEINGVFFSETECVVLSKTGMFQTAFSPISLMSDNEKKQLLYEIRQAAKNIKPLD
jgi:hypothetical protein